jgi:hypothetical protein
MASLGDNIDALGSMTPAQLRAEWRRIFRRETPPHSPDLLARAISWRWQAQQHGDLTLATRRELDSLAHQLIQNGSIDAAGPSKPSVGTQLIREWNGRTIKVLITENGYLFEDRSYRSLSQIARHVTGARWSGPRFFGLVKRSTEQAASHG